MNLGDELAKDGGALWAKLEEAEAVRAGLLEACRAVIACKVCCEDYGRCMTCDGRLRAAISRAEKGGA